MIPSDVLKKLVEKRDLSSQEAGDFLEGVMNGSVSPTISAAILTALRMKGESIEEVVGLVRAMRSHMILVSASGAMDIVGTGGDGSNTFNVSTTTALVVAGAGVPVAKHGNRAASSKCGSADVLEALGVNIQLNKEQAEEVFRKVGFVFMLAPLFHPSTKNVVAVRKELKIRTIFNVLGPFANPAATKVQLTGVPDVESAKKLAAVAAKLGYKRNLIVTGGGMDEVGLNAPTVAYEVCGTRVRKFAIDPQKLGLKKVSSKALLGGGAKENAAMVEAILLGEKGPRRDIVVLNSACALYAMGKARTIREAMPLAIHSIESGEACGILSNLRRETQQFAQRA
jgi:anthranilate phosphoribosyltransferase